MRPTPQLSVKTCGGGQGGGRSAGGWGGGGGISSSAGGGPKGGGGLRATHDYHMHTSRGCVCVWGHGGTEVCMR